MTMYLVLSALTSSPISLVAAHISETRWDDNTYHSHSGKVPLYWLFSPVTFLNCQLIPEQDEN